MCPACCGLQRVRRLSRRAPPPHPQPSPHTHFANSLPHAFHPHRTCATSAEPDQWLPCSPSRHCQIRGYLCLLAYLCVLLNAAGISPRAATHAVPPDMHAAPVLWAPIAPALSALHPLIPALVLTLRGYVRSFQRLFLSVLHPRVWCTCRPHHKPLRASAPLPVHNSLCKTRCMLQQRTNALALTPREVRGPPAARRTPGPRTRLRAAPPPRSSRFTCQPPPQATQRGSRVAAVGRPLCVLCCAPPRCPVHIPRPHPAA